MKNAVEIADGIDLSNMISTAVKAAEKSTGLARVFLQRESFAGRACSTGILELDRIMGGGIPPARIVGISGPEHTGKSFLATQIAVEQLKSQSYVVYNDAEGGNDPLWLKARGIDFDKYRGARDKNGNLKPKERDQIFYYQPETGEQFRDFSHSVMSALPENRNASSPSVIFILDSVVALITDAMSEDLDSNKMAMHAKMYSEMLPVLNAQLVRTGSSFVYMNQLREKPGQSYGDPRYEPAGSALRFFASIRIRLESQKPKLMDDDHPFINEAITGAKPRAGGIYEEPHVDADGNPTKALDRYVYIATKTVKNKVYNPFKVSWFRINIESNGGTGFGLDPVFDTCTFLVNSGVAKLVKGPAKPGQPKQIFEIVKDVGIAGLEVGKTYGYREYQKYVKSMPELTKMLRDRLMVTGECFAAAEGT